MKLESNKVNLGHLRKVLVLPNFLEIRGFEYLKFSLKNSHPIKRPFSGLKQENILLLARIILIWEMVTCYFHEWEGKLTQKNS